MSKGFSLGITEEDLEKTGGNSSFIGTSGVYDATILAVVVDENEHGSITLGFYVDAGGEKPQMLYSALALSTFDNSKTLDNNRKVFGGLCMLAGVAVNGKFNPVEAVLPIGKNGAEKEVLILDDFEDIPVKMWVKQEYYRKGTGEIGDRRTVMRFYRQNDNADASELKNPETIGTRFEKDSKYHSDIKYAEGVTAEDVKNWLDGLKANKTTGTKTTAEAAPAKSRFKK